MRQEYVDLTNYMALDDRSDAKKWAWPGETADTWSSDGADQWFQDFFGKDATEEVILETREENNVGTAILTESLWTDEYRDAVEFIDEFAPACAEEPDAPDVELRITVPAGYDKSEKLPVVLMIHGAGYMFLPTIFDVEAAHYVKDLHCAVVAPNYRKYPENVFPATLNDVQATYEWIIANADAMGFDADRIVVKGDSFGGLQAVALAHRLKRVGLPRPRGIVAIAPVIEDREVGTSGRICWSDGGQPSPYSYHICWEGYAGYGNAGNSALGPEVFPNHATVEEVRDLPPMCIHINESDVQRDGEIQYCQKLLDAGVFCSMHVWAATHHGFALAAAIVTSEDELMKRVAGEIMADIKGFFDHDFRR